MRIRIRRHLSIDSKSVCWTANARRAVAEDISINHCRLDVTMVLSGFLAEPGLEVSSRMLKKAVLVARER